MKRLGLFLLLAACAHVQTSALPDVDESVAALDDRPVLLASADVGTSVRDWYASKLLRQPLDPFNPRFTTITATGIISGGANSTFAGPLIITGNAQLRGLTSAGSFLDLSANLAQMGSSSTYWICQTSTGSCGAPNGTKITSAQASGNDAFAATVSGAHWHIGAGGSDYLSSDGTTITSAAPFTAATINATSAYNFGGNAVLNGGNGQAGSTDLRGNAANSAGNTGNTMGNTTSLTAGMDRYIETFYNDLFSTVRSRIASNGTYLNTATVGTAASGTGVTANYSGASPYWLHKVTITNAAMTAAATTDITIEVTPTNSAIRRVVADVTQVFTGGALSAVTVTCGNAAGGNQYLLSNSFFTAQNVWGDVAAEIGAGLLSATIADFGTASAGTNGAITVSCRFTCTGANCNAATQGSATFYTEGVTYF
jgi:hypothetical protein